MRYTGLIEKYRDRLPVGDKTRLISLGEGTLHSSDLKIFLVKWEHKLNFTSSMKA